MYLCAMYACMYVWQDLKFMYVCMYVCMYVTNFMYGWINYVYVCINNVCICCCMQCLCLFIDFVYVFRFGSLQDLLPELRHPAESHACGGRGLRPHEWAGERAVPRAQRAAWPVSDRHTAQTQQLATVISGVRDFLRIHTCLPLYVCMYVCMYVCIEHVCK